MDSKPVCEDVTIPDTVVKVDGCLLPVDSNAKIGISALTKLFSAKKKRRKQFLIF
jgi:hypothetical protein